jgi:hypothetical protein
MNTKLGYYKVNDSIFFNRLQAILFANETLADITWNFKDKYPDVESVLFYYLPELLSLMVKQAHDLIRRLLLPENSIPRPYVQGMALHKYAKY